MPDGIVEIDEKSFRFTMFVPFVEDGEAGGDHGLGGNGVGAEVAIVEHYN